MIQDCKVFIICVSKLRLGAGSGILYGLCTGCVG